MDTNEDTNTQGKIMFRCNQCGKRLSALKSKLGSEHICPYCGFANLLSDQNNPASPTASNSRESDAPSFANTERNSPAREKEENQRNGSSWKKNEKAFLTYFILGLSLMFCLISIILFTKTLQLNAEKTSASSSVEDLLVDKEAEQSIYNPVDITGKTIGLDEGMDQESAKRLQDAAKRSSSKPEESDIQEIHTLFKKFSKDMDLNKRLEFVFTANEMKPLMEQWEKEQPFVPSSPDIVLSANHTDPFMGVRFSIGSTAQKDVVFIHDAESGQWKVDWPHLVGYSQYSGKKLSKIRPATPIPVRVILSMGDAYETPFLDRPDNSNYEGKSYMSISITFPDGQEFSGFVDRHSDTALKLSEKLMFGSAQMMVKIHFPSDPSILNKNIVIIDEFIRDNWLSDKANELLQQAILQAK